MRISEHAGTDPLLLIQPFLIQPRRGYRHVEKDVREEDRRPPRQFLSETVPDNVLRRPKHAGVLVEVRGHAEITIRQPKGPHGVLARPLKNRNHRH